MENKSKICAYHMIHYLRFEPTTGLEFDAKPFNYVLALQFHELFAFMLCSIPSVYHNSHETNVFGGIVESACVSVRVYVCLQNTIHSMTTQYSADVTLIKDFSLSQPGLEPLTSHSHQADALTTRSVWRTNSCFFMYVVQVFSKHCGSFPEVFSTPLENFLSFSWNLILSSTSYFRFEGSEIHFFWERAQ